jgi:transcriptional adapter 2-alpha
MPLRGEYDTEWENDAELAIAETEFLSTDTEEDKEAKLQALREYNRALDERQVKLAS